MSDATKRIHRQHLRHIAARADVQEGIRQGLEDIKNGKVRPAREFLKEFEAKYGIPRIWRCAGSITE
jgi:predicted transcriptional regulator